MSEERAADEAPKKSKKGLMLAIAGVVAVGGAAGAWFAFGGTKADKDAPPAQEVKLPPQFHALEPPFVVNFQPGSQARFLQVAVQVMTRDPALVTQLEHLNPMIRNDLLLLYGNKQVSEVASAEGREALRAATLEAVRKIIADEGGKPESLENVYFTSFVMQ